MKTKLLFLFLSISITTFSQKIKQEIISFQSSERNKKTIVFSKETSSTANIFIIKARNKPSADYASCEWNVKLSKKHLKQLHESLSAINFNDKINISYSKFDIRVKNKKVRITFFNSSCTNEHSTHYFQKSCNRELSFFMNKQQITSFIQKFNKEIPNTLVRRQH